MAITNEEAMRELSELKLRGTTPSPEGHYWCGVFHGKSGAYMRMNVITYDQYRTMHDFDRFNAVEVSAT